MEVSKVMKERTVQLMTGSYEYPAVVEVKSQLENLKVVTLFDNVNQADSYLVNGTRIDHDAVVYYKGDIKDASLEMQAVNEVIKLARITRKNSERAMRAKAARYYGA